MLTMLINEDDHIVPESTPGVTLPMCQLHAMYTQFLKHLNFGYSEYIKNNVTSSLNTRNFSLGLQHLVTLAARL